MKRDYLVIGLIAAVIFLLLLIISCSEDSRKIDLVQNNDQRQVVFSQILENREVMTDLMNQIGQNELAMQWMMQDSTLMYQMFTGDNFGYMVSQFPSMRDSMMQNMAGMLGSNQTSMMQWNSMMQEQGHPRAMMNRNQ